jgi:hypothetical protein
MLTGLPAAIPRSPRSMTLRRVSVPAVFTIVAVVATVHAAFTQGTAVPGLD